MRQWQPDRAYAFESETVRVDQDSGLDDVRGGVAKEEEHMLVVAVQHNGRNDCTQQYCNRKKDILPESGEGQNSH